MRVVPINELRPDMRLGKDVCSAYGELYLRKDTLLTDEYIRRLHTLGFNGIVIDDPLSEGIELEDLVDSTLRDRAVCKVRELYRRGASCPMRKSDWRSLESLLHDILSELLETERLANNIIDLKAFDDYTFCHSVNVAFLSAATGISLGLTRAKLHELLMGAILHDIGKIYVPHSILSKPSALTREEFEIMKTHSRHGYEYLSGMDDMVSQDACIGVLHHHERFDGRGYPSGLAGGQIAAFGRIIAVCDVYDAITSNRPYRTAWSPSEAIEYIMGNLSIQFEPDVARAFLKRIAPYPAGTLVRLSDGRAAIVVRNNPDLVFRPLVRIYEHEGEPVTPYFIDMASDRTALSVTIQAVLSQSTQKPLSRGCILEAP
ncbi:MAG: HD-GYP domain-containing protein [Clostridiales bacterium]|nr:HD-GYP domain-containing protein [Clostridiales bacterium]